MGKLLAIDGLSITRRMYEANKDPDSPEKAEAAIRNSVSAVRKLIALHQPTHVLPSYDFGGPTWRHELYPEYRSLRKPMPEALKQQLPSLYARLHELGMHVVCHPGVEADDVIGTVVTRWLAEGRGEAIIATNDKDLHVLIAKGAVVYEYFSEEWRDGAWVEAKYGVPPALMTDLLALWGDASDGVPGVTGIAVKTAAKLLNSYGDLDRIMAGAGILKNKTGEALRKERDILYLSRRLVDLKTDVHLGITWRTLAYTAN